MKIQTQAPSKETEVQLNSEVFASIEPAKGVTALTVDQQAALNVMLAGENVFLTGAAGTGKSTVVRAFAGHISSKSFPLLASTGVAAMLIGGRTFHSFFGLGIMEGGEKDTVARALADKRLVKRIRQTQGFLVDEVSMLSSGALRAAEAICRAANDTDLPWGGLQAVAVGDFAQLPPVERGQQKSWTFQDDVWKKSQFVNFCLARSMRTGDTELLDALADLREGQLTDRLQIFLNAHVDELAVGSEKTHLFARREPTENFNLQKLHELPGDVRIIPTEFGGVQKFVEQLKRSCPVGENLLLKLGCKVMLRQNDPRGRWVNGSVGKVLEIEDEVLWLELNGADKSAIGVGARQNGDGGREVKVDKTTFQLLNGEGAAVAYALNFPVQLAYATTIHKSQGSTLSEMVVDLAQLWEPGHAYVALSRAQSADGIKISRWSKSSIRADRQVLQFYAAMADNTY